MKYVFLLVLIIFTTYESQAQGWIELGSDSNPFVTSTNTYKAINSIVTDNSGNVYAAGTFSDSTGKLYVSKWNGTQWIKTKGVGSNYLSSNEGILSIAVDKIGNLYAAGDFAHSQFGSYYVAKWNGTTWSELGTPTDTLDCEWAITTIAVDDSGFVYAGIYSQANGFSIAKWNGIKWSTLGILSNPVVSIVVDKSGNVYTGGQIDSGGWGYVAKWNGTAWSQLGTGTNALKANYAIKTIVIDGIGNLYAAGDFTDASGYFCVSKWNGTSWSVVGGAGSNSIGNEILSIAVDKYGNIYAGGVFTDYWTNYCYIAKWDGTSWSKMLGGTPYQIAANTAPSSWNMNNNINSITIDNSGNIYTAGQFTNGNGNEYVAVFNPAIATAVTTPLITSELQVYPKPTNGNVNINLPEDGQLSVYNFSGVLISTKKCIQGTTSIDLGNESSGIYTLVFNGQNTYYTPIKIVKQ